MDFNTKETGMTNNSTKQLRRQDGVVAGVCGGLGEFFGIDPLWFRLLFLFLMLPGGLPGLLPYLLLWIIIPRK
jgi:phage shock protein C